MLLRIRIANFRSIADAQELSLIASKRSEHSESVVHLERYGIDVLRGAAVYGPNASGKSTLVRAFSFLKDAVTQSHRHWDPASGVPRVSFSLDPELARSPSRFVLDFVVEGVRFEYGLAVDSERVLEEWLTAFPKGRPQQWFSRNTSREHEFVFSRLLTGGNRVIRDLTRPNSLFLSAAAQNNHAMLAPIYRWFTNLWVFDNATRNVSELVVSQLCMDERLHERIRETLALADLGISGIDIIEEDLGSFAKRFDMAADAPRITEVLLFPPRAAGGVRLRHRSQGAVTDVSLPFDEESEGTRTMFALAGTIHLMLGVGGIFIVDELDRSLHPFLASRIVKMFNSPSENPRNAQLIFNTHDTNLLDTTVLRRDQIWFTEKSDAGATQLYPLTDFHARTSENVSRGYLQGRYGAVPSVPDEAVLVGHGT